MTDDMKLAIDSLDKLVGGFHKDAAKAPNAATKRDLTKIGEFAGNVATIIKREHAALESANAALVAECERLRGLVERAFTEGFDAAPDDKHWGSNDAEAAWKRSDVCDALLAKEPK